MAIGLCFLHRACWIVPIGSCLLDRACWILDLDRAYWIVPIGSCLLDQPASHPAASQPASQPAASRMRVSLCMRVSLFSLITTQHFHAISNKTARGNGRLLANARTSQRFFHNFDILRSRGRVAQLKYGTLVGCRRGTRYVEGCLGFPYSKLKYRKRVCWNFVSNFIV